MVIFLSLFSEEWLVKEILAIKKEKPHIASRKSYPSSLEAPEAQ